MSGQALKDRLSLFKQKCAQILGPKRQGYDELSQLEQPLVPGGNTTGFGGGQSSDEYRRRHGVGRPGQGLTPGHEQAFDGNTSNLQTEELLNLIALGKEAAEILWEMAALHDQTEGTKEMLENVHFLQARIRGMVSDYKEGNEAVLAQALEIFDTLSTSLSEYESALSPKASSTPAQSFAPSGNTGYPTLQTGGQPARVPPPSYQQNPFQPAPQSTPTPQAAPGKKTTQEADLISFD